MTDKRKPDDALVTGGSPRDTNWETHVPDQSIGVPRSSAENADVANHETLDAAEFVDPYTTNDPNETIALNEAEAEPFDPYATEDSPPPDLPKVSTGQTTVIPPIGTSTLLPVPSLETQTTEFAKDSSPAIDQTIAFSDIDKTVQLSSNESRASALSADEKSKKTVPDSQIDQTIEFPTGEHDGQDRTIELGTTTIEEATKKPSVLNDTNVTQTINPRELSEEDAAFWGSISRGSANVSHQSQRSPAINRSLSETKLHLRGQVITDVRSEQARYADYRLVRLLGKGGMGNVYVARQGSLDRLVALKVIKPLEAEKQKRFKEKGTLEQVETERRLQFISEAVVTGDLDHPNIVPIHDIAVTGDNTLFYSMKRVSGTPWSKAIHEKSRDENIDILLKVCDAIGFAHTRGVVHRDIKPENIMLGEFGVVMVMDWGLALAKPEFDKIESVHPTTGLGGSPAYMAPEMAIGPVDRIGPASDIYLLGATLFQIITGVAPHHASNVSECLKAVAANKIREVPPEKQGELLQIALKAMATRPEDRHATVRDFQEAIRSYRSHSESIALAVRANEDLTRAGSSSSYDDYSRAMFGFEEALVLWSQNEKAIEGLAATKLAYATEAYRKGDFDLGLSLLDRNDGSHQSLIGQLEDGKKERLAKTARLSLLRKATAAMLAFIFIGGAAALYTINERRNAEAEARRQADLSKDLADRSKDLALAEAANARKAEAVAEKKKDEADRAARSEATAKLAALGAAEKALAAEKVAKSKEMEAVVERNNAIEQKRIAELATSEALRQKENAERATAETLYTNYLAQIGLAHAYINQNNFERAREILLDLKEKAKNTSPAWEWRWLWKQTSQAIDFVHMASPPATLDLSRMPNHFQVVLENGVVQRGTVSLTGEVQLAPQPSISGEGIASATVQSHKHDVTFIGTKSGDIERWNADLSKKLATWSAHPTTINRLMLLNDDVLVSASDDTTIRIWDIQTQQELGVCWNLGQVKDIALAREGNSWTAFAAIAESKFGRVAIWRLTDAQGQWNVTPVGDFIEHGAPVLSVSVSPSGTQAASGDALGNVFLWNPKQIQPVDYKNEVVDAISKLRTPGASKVRESQGSVLYSRLIDQELKSSVSNQNSISSAHADRVRVVRFSTDGNRLLTAGEDYLLRVWDVASSSLKEVLRGHGGWVVDANFMDAEGDQILSTSTDGTIRVWKASNYVNAAVHSTLATVDKNPLHDEEILAARLNHAGDAIVSASRDRKAIISRIDPTTMKTERIAELRDELDPVALKEGTTFIAQSFALDLPHSRLYVGSADATVRAWDLERGTELFEVNNTGFNSSIALSKDGRYLLTRSSTQDAKALIWRLDPTKRIVPSNPKKLVGHHPDVSVTAFAVSPNGSRVFTGDNIGFGYLWDGWTGTQIGDRIDVARGFRINDAEFIGDGKEILIASDNRQVTRLTVDNREVVTYAHPGIVSQFAVSADETYMVSLSEQIGATVNQVEVLWRNLKTGATQSMERFALPISPNGTTKENTQTVKPKSKIASLEFGPDGRSLAISRRVDPGKPTRVVIWAVDANGQPAIRDAFDIPPVLGTVEGAIPLVSNQVLTLNGDAAFRWDRNMKTQVMSYRANASVHHANFSSDDQFVITGSHSVKIWDAKTNLSVAKVERPHNAPLTCVEFTPQQRSYQFATGAKDGSVKLFDFDPIKRTTTEKQTWQVGNQGDVVRCVRFSPTGAHLLAVGDRGMAKLIPLNAGGEITDISVQNAGDFLAAAFSIDSQFIVVGGTDSKARLWSLNENGMPEAAPKLFEGHSDQIEDVMLLSSPTDKLRVLTASRDKSIKVWDPRADSTAKPAGEVLTPREVLTLREHTLGVTAVDATDNGNIVISAGRDATVVIWPAADLAESDSVQIRID